jgi:hypothetical protein
MSIFVTLAADEAIPGEDRIFLWELSAGGEEALGTGNREQGIGTREQGIGDRGQGLEKQSPGLKS